ncbi:hypothetical protein SAMN05421636_104215 [Pricia antarctica]|uniref:DUF4258 domain-containing protein n=1 Tax=Pricia antarctica TaxID=641691 RepID=A0A1G7BLX8_9FLAO|nr:DUF4258 domain-containing protein [Pricia antarctica]SDE28141.1 hypothetical protein SAMN05421636_104215 [Pricia antarctica]
MALIKRLGFFLVGLSIGIMFLTFFLRKKTEQSGFDFCYLPNCRTLKNIRSKPMSNSGEIQRMLANKELDSLDIVRLLNDGDVDFGRSDTETEPCKTYYIEGWVKEKEAILKVTDCLEDAVLEEFVVK